MNERKRILLLIVIMTVSSIMIEVVTIVTLYKTSLEELKQRLVVSARSQARLIEEIASFHEKYTNDFQGGFYEATLHQIVKAHDKYIGFGKTEEFVIAKKEKNNMVFILLHQRSGSTVNKKIPFVASNLAEPMRLALKGQSGKIIGLDYEGELVLAAYEYVPKMDWGIVAKIDMAEVHGFFIKAGLIAVVFTFFIIFAGALLFIRITNPIILKLKRRTEEEARRLKEQLEQQIVERTAQLTVVNQELEKEIAERKKAEELLMESERRFREVLENVKLIAATLDPQGNITFCNDFMLKLTGWKREKVLHKNWFEIFLPIDIRDTIKESVFKEIIEKDQFPLYYENEIITRYGQRKMIAWNNTRFCDSQGKVTAITFIGIDITASRLAEEALRESEKRYRSVVEDQTEVICRFLPDGTFTFVNELYCRLFGKTKDELIFRRWQPQVFHDDLDIAEKKLKILSPSKPVVVIENRVYTGKGDIRWMQFVNRGFFNKNGKLLEIQTVGRDITDRKLAEKALQESEEKYRTLFENMVEGVFIQRYDGAFIEVNPAALDMFGLTREQFFNRTSMSPEWNVIKEDGSIFSVHQYPSNLALRKRKPVYNVVAGFYNHKKEDYVWLTINAIPRFKPGKKHPYEVVVTLHDITKHRQTEELRRAKIEAETANQTKNIFLTSMSHELRTPLNAILGYAQILKKDPSLNEKQMVAIDTIQRSGEHLLLMINDILDISKIESQEIELMLSDFNLHEFLNHIVEVARVQGQKNDLCFIREIDETVPKYVRADEKRLRQVLLNLLSNAIKFTPKGTILLKLYKNKEKIVFLVKDTGIGIPFDKQQEIFLPFHQVHDRRLQPEGTGLGLSISRQLVRLMGGEILVTSEPEQGSSFWFELAFYYPQEIQEYISVPSREIAGYKGKKRKILIVDDIEDNRKMLADMLNSFEIEEAKDGFEALKKVQEFHPELILMDLYMSHLDGEEAARRIRQLQLGKEIIIIAVSADVTKNGGTFNRDMVFNDLLFKPIKREELFNRIRTYLNLNWAYKDISEAATVETSPEAIIIPLKNELDILLDMTGRGDILSIQKQAEQKRKSHDQYHGFWEKIYQFSMKYQLKRIKQIIVENIEE